MNKKITLIIFLIAMIMMAATVQAAAKTNLDTYKLFKNGFIKSIL